MDPSGNARRGGSGRGRGRGRGVNPPDAPQRGGVGAGARPNPVYANPPTGPPVARVISMGDGPRAPSPNVAGRAVTHRETVPIQPNPSSAPPVEQGATAAVAEGRGGLRGKRVITETFPTRPNSCVRKSGTVGTKINVQANYFRILKKVEWTLFQYRVDFSPEIDLLRARRYYVAQHKEILGGYIFDGTVIFCVQNLKQENMEFQTKNREGETILMRLKKVGILKSTDYQQLQVLNLILRRAMEGLNLQLVGRNFFDAVAKVNLGQYMLEIWPGYTTSIRQHEQDILLCCEIAHKVMRTDSVYKTLLKCLQESDNYQDAFKRQVVGTIVLTDYNNKTYRIDDVDFNLSPRSTFPTKNGDITYEQYYTSRYKLRIRDLKQPMLVSRPTEKNMRAGQNEFIMLVPELCRSTGLTDDMRADFRLMKAMGEHTRLMPERRIERLKMFNNRLQQAKASVDVLRSWNMKLDQNLVEVPARILPTEKIMFGNNHNYRCDARADWTQEFRKHHMYSHKDMKRWIIITPGRNVKEVQNFVALCVRAGQGMGVQILNPKYVEIRDDRTNSYSDAIATAVSFDPQFLMIVLIGKNEEKYSCIKKICCVDRPIPSQVVVLKTIAPRGPKAAGLLSIATKVVIQINAKLGGAPWLIDLPVRGLMTVGFDVCHSAKDKNKSYGAIVATMNIIESTRCYSNVMKHEKNQELSNEISMNISYALKAYREEHGALPDRILFYRDGVGDGQLHQVFNTEVNFIKEKLDAIYKSAGVAGGCRFAFIVVSKRINTRYFVNRQNPVPGTVVDDIITLPERYDFFLVSQSVNQGTVSPTSYNVIFDTSGLDANKMQLLTYKMTHNYYNWSGTCRVPAVCQYAHKLAFLVAESIHRNPSNALESQLYFL